MRLLLLLSTLLVTIVTHRKHDFLEMIKAVKPKQHVHYGSNLENAPREVLLAAIKQLRKENTDRQLTLDASKNCTICFSSPCLNNGVCQPVSVSNYTCDCPDDYSGVNCENHLVCSETSCGENATCHVQNHQINCKCNLGFSGNPYNGCGLVTKSSCFSGDPHYKTFDGMMYDYMGTCPTIFSEPCTTLAGGYASFSVKPQNYLNSGTGVGSVASASAVQVEMYGQTIILQADGTVFFNEQQVFFDYYWPNNITTNITITDHSITNDQQVSVTFSNGIVCLVIPDVDEFKGNDTLCGLAGNYDGNWENDLKLRNGSVLDCPACNATAIPRMTSDEFADNWMTAEFWHYNSIDACLDGTTVSNMNITCNLPNTAAKCLPIYDVVNNKGPFASCGSAMDEETVMKYYDRCIYAVCNSADGIAADAARCAAITNFAHECQQEVPSAMISGWRNGLQCPLTCVINSSYKDCTSSCPATCSDHDADAHCGQLCVEGCECNYGYVKDNTQSNLACIKIGDCGCFDPNGNPHPADVTWLTDNCTVQNVCINGTFNTQKSDCSVYAHCTIANGVQQCMCDTGFTGDGYTCTDIDECLDPTVCSVNEGHGSCSNTIGSYYCNCSAYYVGHDCEDYKPNRHCADLVVYHNVTESGLHEVLPPGAAGTIQVYCDMESSDGGWTMLSSADTNLDFFAYSMANYVKGMGPDLNDDNGTASVDVWLGLKHLYAYTSTMETSLRVEIYRCTEPQTECIYDFFAVLDDASGYAVNITKACHGSELDGHHNEGWARWDLSSPGPAFTTLDNDTLQCSAEFQNTGWWYKGKTCGSANLNGVRISCDNQPADPTGYIQWSGNPIEKSRMMIRPKAFPHYDL